MWCRVPNPFKPSAGASPPVLIGRKALLEEFQESIEDVPGAPGLLRLISGARGVGKTVMLQELGNIAAAHDWMVIHETANSDVLGRIRQQARSVRRELGSPGVSTSSTWSEELSSLLDALQPHGAGVCITIDEIQALDTGLLRELAAQMQTFIRDNQPVGLILGGLSHGMRKLFSGGDEAARFFGRAEHSVIGDVFVRDVAQALNQTFSQAGRHIEDKLVWECAEATGGYPYMTQLVGYHVWRQGRDGPVTLEHVKVGIAAAQNRLGRLVISTALKDLSHVDRTFLVHMATDDGPSRVSEIGARLGRDGNYATVYRQRLMTAEMIRPVGHGLVDFAMPHMREYLREHAEGLMAGRL